MLNAFSVKRGQHWVMSLWMQPCSGAVEGTGYRLSLGSIHVIHPGKPVKACLISFSRTCDRTDKRRINTQCSDWYIGNSQLLSVFLQT